MTESHEQLSAAQIEAAKRRLEATFRDYRRCAIALSGGVDSAVAAKAAVEALGDDAAAYTGVGPAVSEEELESARQAAAQIGIRHELIDVREIDSPNYVRNGPDRCYHCKSELYDQIAAVVDADVVVVNGTNRDDLGDYRPGLQAAAERAVRTPLADCEIDKKMVRALAKSWGLSLADKPAAPCLASRIAYGTSVTPERLAKIESAERMLRKLGFNLVRVRLHEGELARIEAPLEAVARLASPPLRDRDRCATDRVWISLHHARPRGFSQRQPQRDGFNRRPEAFFERSPDLGRLNDERGRGSGIKERPPVRGGRTDGRGGGRDWRTAGGWGSARQA